MFNFYDSKPYVTNLFVGSAVCADEATRAVLQNGGFVFITNNGKGKTPTANLPQPTDDAGVSVLNTKLVYPVFIPRKKDVAANFEPIQQDGLISYVDDTNYTGYVDRDSFTLAGGSISAGDALVILNDAAAEVPGTPGTGGTSGIPKLSKSTDGSMETTVAYCIAPPTATEMKIKWIGC